MLAGRTGSTFLAATIVPYSLFWHDETNPTQVTAPMGRRKVPSAVSQFPCHPVTHATAISAGLWLYERESVKPLMSLCSSDSGAHSADYFPPLALLAIILSVALQRQSSTYHCYSGLFYRGLSVGDWLRCAVFASSVLWLREISNAITRAYPHIPGD